MRRKMEPQATIHFQSSNLKLTTEYYAKYEKMSKILDHHPEILDLAHRDLSAPLFKAAKANNMPVFVSPHYYYPTDHGWKFEGALEKLMHNIGMFDRNGALTTEGFEGSGADWLESYKPYINDGKTIVSNPHKVYGPETNDLVLQLRKRGIDKVILGGMSANLCTESHMRELMEQGFEVAVVSYATAAAIVEEGDGYEAALVNFRFIANTVWTTQQAVQKINGNK